MSANEKVDKLIKAVEQADSAPSLLAAVKALAAIRHQAAIPTLVEVLGYNNPGAAVAAVEGLINLGEIAVAYLLEKVDPYNYGARAWATRVFAGVGDPRALDLLIEAAKSDFALSVRRAAAKGLGNITWSKLPEEEAKISQIEVLETLLLASEDPEWAVRYSAVSSLQSLAIDILETQVNLLDKILARFQQMIDTESELSLRARVKLACQEIKLVGNSH
jgi:phycocyanobilin lyase beta subunit